MHIYSVLKEHTREGRRVPADKKQHRRNYKMKAYDQRRER